MENPWHYIVQNIDESYRCIICGWEDMDDQFVTEHVNEEEHQEAIEQYARDLTLQGYKVYFCGLCQCPISGYENVYKHLTGEKHAGFLNKYSTKSGEEMSEDEDENEDQDEDEDQVQGINTIIQEGDEIYYCIICGLGLESNKYPHWHIHSSEHCNSLEKFGDDIADLGRNNYRCNLCECDIPGYKNVFKHLKGQKHEHYLYHPCSEAGYESEESYVDYSINPWNFIVKIDNTCYDCIICNENMAGNALANDHVNGEEHWDNVRDFGQVIHYKGFDSYKCELCDCTITSFKDVYEHLTGQEHQGKMYD